MNDDVQSSDGFLVEVMIGGAPVYVHCTRASGNMNADSVQGLPRDKLEQAFEQRALRAISIAGRPEAKIGMNTLMGFAKKDAGQSMD